MQNNLIFHNQDKALKTTSLLYFKEALIKEQYEDCAELIHTAKRLGAEQDEISEVIAEYLRTLKGGQQNKIINEGRRRFF